METIFADGHRHAFPCAGGTNLQNSSDPTGGPKDSPEELLVQCARHLSLPSAALPSTVTPRLCPLDAPSHFAQPHPASAEPARPARAQVAQSTARYGAVRGQVAVVGLGAGQMEVAVYSSVQIVSDAPQDSQSRKYVVLSLRTLTPLSRPLAPQEEHTNGIVVFFWHSPHCQ